MTTTLEQVRDWHRRKARACAPFEAEQAQGALHDDMADAIDAHLAEMGEPVAVAIALPGTHGEVSCE